MLWLMALKSMFWYLGQSCLPPVRERRPAWGLTVLFEDVSTMIWRSSTKHLRRFHQLPIASCWEPSYRAFKGHPVQTGTVRHMGAASSERERKQRGGHIRKGDEDVVLVRTEHLQGKNSDDGAACDCGQPNRTVPFKWSRRKFNVRFFFLTDLNRTAVNKTKQKKKRRS